VYDLFCSYARIDGSAVVLRVLMEALGLSVWFDEVAIRPGQEHVVSATRRDGLLLVDAVPRRR
jgi:hypothetical protein